MVRTIPGSPWEKVREDIETFQKYRAKKQFIRLLCRSLSLECTAEVLIAQPVIVMKDASRRQTSLLLISKPQKVVTWVLLPPAQ